MQRPEHEKLTAYERSLDVVVQLAKIAHEFPAPWGDLRDQLRRAATSIALNIAEGAGEFSPAAKAGFYRTARRSASECLAVLDVSQRILREPPAVDDAKAALTQLSGMLTNMVKALEARPGKR